MNGYRDALDIARDKFIRENGGIVEIDTRKYYNPTDLAPGVDISALPSEIRGVGENGEFMGYNQEIPGMADLEREQARQAVRDAWTPGAGSSEDRGMAAAIGAVGLYSVIGDLGEKGAGLEEACVAFFEAAKEIHQAAAMEEIYGPGYSGMDLDQQSLDAVKDLNAAVDRAGLYNSSDRDYEQRQADTVMLFDQEISAKPGSGDARAFIMEFMAVAQDGGFTQNVQKELEQMGRQARVNALLYRNPESVPENLKDDKQTRSAVKSMAWDLDV